METFFIAGDQHFSKFATGSKAKFFTWILLWPIKSEVVYSTHVCRSTWSVTLKQSIQISSISSYYLIVLFQRHNVSNYCIITTCFYTNFQIYLAQCFQVWGFTENLGLFFRGVAGFFEDLRVFCFWACFIWCLLDFWACFCRFLFSRMLSFSIFMALLQSQYIE